jgi:DNA repair exonuclease SbcCD ATPase subunit
VRFLDAGYEQAEAQYAELLSGLRAEIDDENALIETTQQLEVELQRLSPTTHEIVGIDELMVAKLERLPQLRSRLDELTKKAAEVQTQHKLITAAPPPTTTSQLARIDDDLNRINASLVDAISAVEKERARQALVESVQKRVDEVASEARVVAESVESLAEEVKRTTTPTDEQLLSSLSKREGELGELHQKLLRFEASPAELDAAEKSDDCAALRRNVDELSERVRRLRVELEEEISTQIANEQLRVKIEHANDSLVSLIDEAQRLLLDASVTPESCERIATRLGTAVDEADTILAEHPLLAENPTADPLRSNIGVANSTRATLGERWRLWLSFVEERNTANAQLDAVRRPLDEVIANDIRSLDDAQRDLKELVVSLSHARKNQ